MFAARYHRSDYSGYIRVLRGLTELQHSPDLFSRTSIYPNPAIWAPQASIYKGHRPSGRLLLDQLNTTNMVSVTLKPSGQEMPLVGFGAWKVDKDTCAEQIYQAIKAGYRLIDGAQDYGNEKECGEGVRRAIKEGIIKREDIFITSKLWNTYHAKEHVEPMLRKTLEDWGLDYVDLFLIHFPIAQKYVDPKERYPPGFLNDLEKEVAYFENSPIHETWAALEQCVNKGLAKNIGISNFNAGLIRDLLTYAKIRPSVLQIEHHPYLTQPDLIKYVHSEGIAITGYSTFGPQSFIELDHPGAKNMVKVLEHETVTSICKEVNKTPAQVILRWATQRDIAVIPKSNKKERLSENLSCLDFELSQKQLDAISGLNKDFRFNNPADWPTPSPIF